jgi:hypothetical protein
MCISRPGLGDCGRHSSQMDSVTRLSLRDCREQAKAMSASFYPYKALCLLILS